jgi:aromatic-L-amino-acid decarboxylase
MTSDEFRHAGYCLVDWLADYWAKVEGFPVLSQVQPGSIRAQLPDRAPEQPEPFEKILSDVDKLILPGLTHWQSPNFFAYFPANTSGPSALGELLSAGLGVQGMLWATSPACTELETHVLDWLADLLELPNEFRSSGSGGGVLQDSASSSVLCALLAARERATQGSSNIAGVRQPLVAYASEQAHSSIEKAVKIAGLGTVHLHAVPVDAQYAMQPEMLDDRIQRDRAAGLVPCFACATVGTTSSNAIDPVRALGHICHKHNIWLHVDAAMCGSAALCPEFRDMHQGLELADSYCVNAHKWLPVNFDCSCFYVRNRAALVGALGILPEYLKNSASAAGTVIDYRDWQVSLGRRFRALKLWFVLRAYGAEKLRAMIRRHVGLAREFAGWVVDDRRFEMAAPVPFNLICFRLKGGDDINQRLLDRLNASGRLYVTHTRLDGRLTLRFCVGQATTERRHVLAAWEYIQAQTAELERSR